MNLDKLNSSESKILCYLPEDIRELNNYLCQIKLKEQKIFKEIYNSAINGSNYIVRCMVDYYDLIPGKSKSIRCIEVCDNYIIFYESNLVVDSSQLEIFSFNAFKIDMLAYQTIDLELAKCIDNKNQVKKILE